MEELSSLSSEAQSVEDLSLSVGYNDLSTLLSEDNPGFLYRLDLAVESEGGIMPYWQLELSNSEGEVLAVGYDGLGNVFIDR